MRLLLLLLLLPAVYAQCVELTDGASFNSDTLLCNKVYDVPSGITFSAKGAVFDCNGAILRGDAHSSDIGLRVVDSDNVQVRNCVILTFDQGMFLKNVTNSIIEKNSVFKNRIGMRLFDVYENIIRSNNDKSFEVPVSSINSKFNVVMLGNRNIDREFCEVNSCNEHKDMTVCESGDFYCSKRCSAENDADCAPLVVPEIPKEPVRTAEKIIEEAEAEIVKPGLPPVAVEKSVGRSLSIMSKFFVYLVLYFVVFILIRLSKKR